MKKKLLPLAMLAGLAGAVGTAQAAHLNSDGLGQVLIYPYYTTLDGQHTDLHLVNTTNQTKAVKIRFLEGQNSREVLDFHIYLSAYDHFTGVITASGEGDARVASFRTNDTTCTVPALPAAGVPFRNFAYESDAGSNALARTLEGYVEVIEMAVLGEEVDGEVTERGTGTFGAAQAAKHVNGEPEGCNKLVSAWSSGGTWFSTPTANTIPGTGGLYGFASVFNVSEGTSATYSATAIDAFENSASLHQRTGLTSPSLAQVDPLVNIFDATKTDFIVTDVVDGGTTPATPIDTISALLTRDTLQNDYITDEDISAETDWVITFPTKRFYVETGRQPFSSTFEEDDLACEHIELVYFDREERVVDNQSTPQFSPSRPGEGFELCTEVNVLSFNGSDVLGSSNGLGKTLRKNLNTEAGFVDGWAKIDLTVPELEYDAATSDKNPRLIVGEDFSYAGLPVVGFAVIKYTNGNLNGVLSNYTGVVDHKYTRLITEN